MDGSTKVQLLVLKGAISELPPEQQAAVAATAKEIRALVEKDRENGTIALALVSIEYSED